MGIRFLFLNDCMIMVVSW